LLPRVDPHPVAELTVQLHDGHAFEIVDRGSCLLAFSGRRRMVDPSMECRVASNRIASVALTGVMTDILPIPRPRLKIPAEIDSASPGVLLRRCRHQLGEVIGRTLAVLPRAVRPTATPMATRSASAAAPV
jgi:hypothetical protein